MRIDSPVKNFESARDLFRQNTEREISVLAEKSGLDIEKNKKLFSQYQLCVDDAKETKDNITNLRIQRALLIILSVLLPLMGLKMIADGISNLEYFRYLEVWEILCYILGILAGICFCLVIILLIRYIVTKINPLLSDKRALQKDLDQKVRVSENACRDDLAPFLELIQPTAVFRMISMTIDGLTVDFFTNQHRVRSITKFKADYFSKERGVSSLQVLSGEYCHNPFLIRESYEYYMGSVKYTGTRTVQEEKVKYNAKGERILTTEEKTLTAYVYKDAPFFRKRLKMTFASREVPELCFSHKADTSILKNSVFKPIIFEKRLDRLNALHNSQVKNSAVKNAITPMANNEFESMFAAFDRNNELEFRKLFTPTAQKNMVDLLKAPDFGNTFNYKKEHMLTYIEPSDSESWDLDMGIQRYDCLNYVEIEKRIKEYGISCFDMLYRLFAPLFCIPLYSNENLQMDEEADSDSTSSEYMAEVLANKIGSTAMLGKETKCIVNAELAERGLNSESYRLDVLYFEEYSRIDTVPASNDPKYTVDVEWTEYDPCHKDLTLRVFVTDMTEGRFFKISKTEAFRQLCQAPFAYAQNLVGVIEKKDSPIREDAFAQLLRDRAS